MALSAQAGDVAAFGELARRFQPRLLNYLRHHCGDTALAEDAIQEAFLAAYQALSRFNPRWQVSTWLFTIARRKAGKLQARTARVQLAAAESAEVALRDTADESRSTEQQACDQEAHGEIWQIAREVLSGEQFNALWMYYVEGLDSRQTALVLEKSDAATRAILSRARQAMKPHVRAWDESESTDAPSETVSLTKSDNHERAGEPGFAPAAMRYAA